MSQPTTVLIAGGGTGGHLMPALAIAGAIRDRHPDWRVVMIGAVRGVEASLLPERDFPYHLLPFEPIYRRQWWRNLRWPLLAISLIGKIRKLLDAERPALVFGTGGYASAPVVWLAARRGIPTAVLDQDAFPGFATRRLAGRVREVYLGAPEAAAHLKPGPGTEVVVTGSPIAPPQPERRAEAFARYQLDPEKPVVLIVGGSQGSLAINERVQSWIESGGADEVSLLWATGKTTYERFQHLARPPKVHVFPFLDPIALGYAAADLVIGRAGMTTIAELCAWGLPSILIPLPTAAADHQTHNATGMANAGAAILLPQRDLTAESLGSAITGLLADRARLASLAKAAAARGRPRATAEIVDRLERLIGAR